MGHTPRRLSVRVYLLISALVCLCGVGALIAVQAVSSFDRERANAIGQVRAAVQTTADGFTTTDTSSAQGFADNASLSDPAACEDALKGLTGVAGVQMYVLRADGTQVCSAHDPKLPDAPYTASLPMADVLAGRDVNPVQFLDTATGQPAERYIFPVHKDGQVGGALVIAEPTASSSPLTVPRGLPRQVWLVALSADGKLVLSTSDHAPVAVGSTSSRSFLTRAVGARGETRTDSKGRTWLLQQAQLPASSGSWRFVAGIPKSVALAPARAELRRSVVLGALILVVLMGIAGLLHRNLVRPIRRLQRAIEHDEDARPSRVTPREVAAVADAYVDQVDRRKALEADLRFQASHDALTLLPNRRELTERIDAAITSGSGHGGVAVLFVDLDRFKLVNDSHGHAVGDQLLVALGARLVESLPGCVVGRFGGDEYVILCTAVTGEVEAQGLADRVASVLHTPFRIGAVEIYASGSVGIAIAQDGESAEDLIRNADTAMYRSKEQGPGRSAVFDRGMRRWAQARFETERELHRALDDGQFELHYQPLFSVQTGELVRAEALVRWRHPERGLVSPADFIPIAEETRLIVPLGEWVIEEAARQVAQWRSDTGATIPVAVNVAAHQLCSTEVDATIRSALRDAGLDAEALSVEITESAVLTDEQTARRTLERLRGEGIRVAVDDFGTGYSSLSYLQRLPIDEVKIDRSFIAMLRENETTAVIVASIVDLAHAVGLSVVAEGVEQAPQLVDLGRMGCDIAQGFYLGRPVPASDLTIPGGATVSRQG
ncbi:MAG: EAL domain-containing protein [Acidimicrobiia bacterium]|nr:EAL domain-containing protein [Acidimicrobiia bacterium]